MNNNIQILLDADQRIIDVNNGSPFSSVGMVMQNMNFYHIKGIGERINEEEEYRSEDLRSMTQND